MFERIVLRRSEHGGVVTAGELAEALLYYQNVHILLDHSSLIGMSRSIGMPTLFSLLKRPNVKATYCEQALVVFTKNEGGIKSHRFDGMYLAGSKDRMFRSKKERIKWIIERSGVPGGLAMRYAERFTRTVKFTMFTGDYYIPGGIPKAAFTDVLNGEFLTDAMQRAIKERAPDYKLPPNFFFIARPVGPHFVIETNLDFNTVNASMRYRNSHHVDLTAENLVGAIVEARGDLVLSSHYGAEFVTDKVTSDVMRLIFTDILKTLDREISERDVFESVTLDEARALKQVINSGHRSFDDFLKILDKADKFKSFLIGANPDEKLIKHYFDEISRQGWLQRLPGKTLRYLFTLGIDISAPGASVPISAADTFIIDKITGGWRPNHFVDRHLRPFVRH